MEDAIEQATTVVYYDDPLHLAVPYTFFLERLPEPPDGLVKLVLSLTLILFVYMYPVVRGLTNLWSRLAYSKLLANNKSNIFIQCGRRRQKVTQRQPTLYIKVYTTVDTDNEESYSWDTDGIPFVIDNSATAIISNQRKLFVGPLTPMSVSLETAEGTSTTTKLVGCMNLVLTDNAN